MLLPRNSIRRMTGSSYVYDQAWSAERDRLAGIEALEYQTVEVRRADVVTDELPEAEFDVVHARLVLEHLTERETVLDKLVAALRPGGWLVVEDYDWTAFGFDAGDGSEQRAAEAVLSFMAQAGFEATYGRRVVGSLAARGLVELRGEGRSLVIDAAHPGYPFFQLSFEQLAPAVVQAGLLGEAEANDVRDSFARGANRVLTPTLVAAMGRRPQGAADN
jgi:SAM-dependent methyltransferase